MTTDTIMFSSNLLVVTLFLLSGVRCGKQPIINSPMGEIEGFYMETRGGKKISAFTSIPYAEPPLGELRFKAPVPVKPWEGILNATIESPICVQRNPYIRQENIVGDEDCLYLNIYSPYTDYEFVSEKKLLPVMVFIHGGGWMCGDSTTKMYGPEFILDKDVLLVTTNYRLGPLGFLSTQDVHCPGNNGLKDQQEALRFIQRNIHSFGGDRNSVTIFGESAGGASVHYHMLSETSAGLFHKAISESGTALVPWAESPPEEAIRNALRLAKFLDCPQGPSKLIINCLRGKDAYDIINTEFKFYVWDYEPMTPFKAVIEPNLPGAFLRKSARSIPDVPSVPWITGLNKDEGCLKSVWITTDERRFDEFMSNFDTIAPVTFYYKNSQFASAITTLIKNKYLNVEDEETIKSRIADLYSDSYFGFPAVEAVELAFNNTNDNIFLYELTYKATNSFSQIFGDPDGDHGVCHADELMHLFPIHFLNKPFSSKDIEMSELIITLWTNFAISGDPNTPSEIPFVWEPTSMKDLKYLDIGSELRMVPNFASRSQFWGTLPLWHRIRGQSYKDEL